MDGVLYDFDSLFKIHMPHVEIEDDRVWTWQELHMKNPNMYLDGKEMPGIRRVYDFVSKINSEVYVLTAIPRRWNWPNVTKHKRQWMADNFGMSADKVLFGPYAEDKQFHVRGPRDILIDDRIRNIEQWNARGGTGIHHTGVESTLGELKQIILGQ